MSDELKQRAREVIEQLSALDSAKRPGGGVHGQVIGMEPYVIRTNGDGLACLWEAQAIIDELVDPFDRRATSGAASGEVVTVPREATEAMLHAAEDVPAPRTYGAVWRAMVGAAEQSAPPVPGMVKTWQERTDTRAMCLPLVAAMQEEIADLRALLATQSASTAPGQADWCPECHARESDGYEQELERDAARYRWLRESGEITASSTKGRIAIPMYTMTEKHKAELDAAIDSAIAALSKEKP